MKGKALWWVLAVVLLALYFVVFRPREAGDGSVPPAQDGQPQQTAPDPADRLPTPQGEGLGLVAPDTGPVEDEARQLRTDREFIARVFPILSTWNMAAVKPLLSPATVEGSTDAQLAEVMQVLSARLGSLQSFEQPEPTANADALQPADSTGRLKHYEFAASYESGVADVDLVLHQLPESSSLYSFNINVP